MIYEGLSRWRDYYIAPSSLNVKRIYQGRYNHNKTPKKNKSFKKGFKKRGY